MDYKGIAQKYKETGTLVILDTPSKTKLGIDNSIWDIDYNFKGFKHIPPGFHYVHYSLASENHLFKQSFLIQIQPGDLVIKKFDANGDLISIDKDPNAQLMGVEENIKEAVYSLEMDKYLGPYPIENSTEVEENYKTWREGTRLINQDLLKIMGVQDGVLYSSHFNEYKLAQLDSTYDQLSKAQKIEQLAQGDDAFKQSNDIQKMQTKEINEIQELKNQKNQNKEKIEIELQDDLNPTFKVSLKNQNQGLIPQSKKEYDHSNILQDKPQSKTEKEILDNIKFGKRFAELSNFDFKYFIVSQQLQGDKLTSFYIDNSLFNHENMIQKPKGDKERDRQMDYLDKSVMIEQIINQKFKGRQELLLGELQLVFIQFVIGQDLDALEQWKLMVDCFFSCLKLVINRPSFYKEFIRVFYEQVKQVGKSLFQEEQFEDVFIKTGLVKFGVILDRIIRKQGQNDFQSIQINLGQIKIIKQRFDKLKEMILINFAFDVEKEIEVLQQYQNIVEGEGEPANQQYRCAQTNKKNFNQVFNDQDDEEPQVVDLNDSLISW